MSKEKTGLLEKLDWDSQFWGINVARLTAPPTNDEQVSVIKQWCERNVIDLAMARVDVAETDLTTRLGTLGFLEVDQRVTLGLFLSHEAVPNPQLSSVVFRGARTTDRGPLGEIARSQFRLSRWHEDPHLTDVRADLFYQRWIEGDLDTNADIVFVATVEGVPVGFVSLKFESTTQKVVIRLIGTTPNYHRQGIARSLLFRAIEWSRLQSAFRIEVVTQARNVGALALYESVGFRVIAHERWLHWWPKMGQDTKA